MRKVEVLLGKDGSVKVEALGFKGSSCIEATNFIRKALGSKSNTGIANSHNTLLKDSYWQEESELNVNGLPSGHCG